MDYFNDDFLSTGSKKLEVMDISLLDTLQNIKISIVNGELKLEDLRGIWENLDAGNFFEEEFESILASVSEIRYLLENNKELNSEALELLTKISVQIRHRAYPIDKGDEL